MCWQQIAPTDLIHQRPLLHGREPISATSEWAMSCVRAGHGSHRPATFPEVADGQRRRRPPGWHQARGPRSVRTSPIDPAGMFSSRIMPTRALCRLRCSTIQSTGGALCRPMKSAGLTVTTVVRSARSISASASLTARAAARLEFHATTI